MILVKQKLLYRNSLWSGIKSKLRELGLLRMAVGQQQPLFIGVLVHTLLSSTNRVYQVLHLEMVQMPRSHSLMFKRPLVVKISTLWATLKSIPLFIFLDMLCPNIILW